MSADVSRKSVEIGERKFIIVVLKVVNGCLLFVSEGSELRFGSVSLSIKSRDKVSSSPVIPSKFGGFLDTVFSEMVANIVNGIALASLFISKEIDSKSMKTLLAEVRSLL